MNGTVTVQLSKVDVSRRYQLARSAVERILASAGITLDGKSPADLRIHDQRFFERVLAEGTLGLGESYMDGWWDCDRLDEFVCRAVASDLDDRILSWRERLFLLWVRCRNLQTRIRAGAVAERHYDLSNEFFARMLGRTMNYSCGYWRTAADLDAAQDAKMDLVARKLQLRPGDRVLDIGCGWGGMARFAAERYGCDVIGITISRQQYEWARSYVEGTRARVLLLDYRSPDLLALAPFDKVISIGAFEHIGPQNYADFCSIAGTVLRHDGLFLLHTIVNDHSPAERWLHKYIFPNGMLPALTGLIDALSTRFVIEDVHNFGADYDRTLMAWYDNYKRHEAEDDFPYPVRFRRMWSYYLLTCAGSFRARTRNQLCQIVASKNGINGGYDSVR